MNLKSQKGSITLFVLVSCLFFLASVACVNMYMQSKQTAVDREYKQVKANYEKDINNMDTIYKELSSKNNLSVNFGIPEINKTTKKIAINIYTNLEYLDIKTLKYGWYYSDEEINKDELKSTDIENWTYVETQNGENEFIAVTNFTQNTGYYYLCVITDNQDIWFKYPINIENEKFSSFYGDIIDYDVDLDINLDSNDNYDWKVFYMDEDTVYIIAEDYVKMTNEKIPTNLGNDIVSGNPYALNWNNNDSIPKNGAIDIFSSTNDMNIKIANKYLSGWKNIMISEDSSTSLENNVNDNARITAVLMDTSIWKTMTNSSKKPKYNIIGCPTIEMWINSWNDKYKNDKIYYSNDENAVGYYIGLNENTNEYQINLSDKSGYKEDPLYFPRKEKIEKCEGYCIASPSSVKNSLLMRVNYNGIVGNSGSYTQHGAVRPVICIPLKMNIQWNSKDEIWHIL